MSTIKRNLQLFWRAERILHEARLKLTARKLALGVAAAITGLFALGMLNLAAFFALEPRIGPAGAATLVGVLDIAAAGILLLIALGLKPAEEEAMVREVRDLAIGEIGSEIEAVQMKFIELREDIEAMRASIAGFIKRPADALSPAMIVSGLSAVSQLVRSKRK